MRLVVPTSTRRAPPLREHVGDPERAADLDELAAAHQHLAPLGVGVDREQHGGRAVVDDHRRLDAEQLAQAGLGVGLALAALAALEVVLEVGVGGRDRGDPRAAASRESGARPEVRVHHDAGRVQHAHERRPRPRPRSAPATSASEARRSAAVAPRVARAARSRSAARAARSARSTASRPCAATSARELGSLQRLVDGGQQPPRVDAGRRGHPSNITRGILAPMGRERPPDFADRLPRVVPKEEADISSLSDEMAELLYPGRRPRPFRVGLRFDRFDGPGLRARARARAQVARVPRGVRAARGPSTTPRSRRRTRGRCATSSRS